MDFLRKRNIQEGTGEPYNAAFTQTEILERGWTISMIRRHLGQPNNVVCCPTTYQFDRRRVYAAEATPAVQFDLLATEDVRLLGTKRLSKMAAYIPNIMRASLLTLAENEQAEKPAFAAEARALAQTLPPAVAPNSRRSHLNRGYSAASAFSTQPYQPAPKPPCAANLAAASATTS